MDTVLKVDTRITVETPEGVDFQYLIAGPGKRGTARVFDGFLQVLVITLLVIPLMLVDESPIRDVGLGILLVLCFLIFTLYGTLFEVMMRGQTPGKMMAKLRVVRSNGTPLGWFEALGRNLLLGIDGMIFYSLPFGALWGLAEMSALPLCTVGLLAMFATGRLQRLGDLVFDTMVIDEARGFSGRQPGVTDGIEIIPPAHCKARYSVPERTIGVIERLFESNRLISDGRREEIARHLSESLRRWLGWEPPPPDPKNPNSFFLNAPVQHTEFLKRVLRTFGDGTEKTSSRHENPAPVRRPEMSTDTRRRSSDRPASSETDRAPVKPPPDTVPAEGLPDDWRKPDDA